MKYKLIGYNLSNDSITISNSDGTPLISIVTSEDTWTNQKYTLPVKGAYDNHMSINYTIDNRTLTITLAEGKSVLSAHGNVTFFELLYKHDKTISLNLKSYDGATHSCSLNSITYIPGIYSRIRYNNSENAFQLSYEIEV